MIFNVRSILIISSLISSACSLENLDVLDYSADREIADDYVLCRNCGSDILPSNYIISKTSPISRKTFNDTIFRKEVLVQVISDVFFHSLIITSAHSMCVGIGEWEHSDFWFPGCRWRHCVCPDCGAVVGYVFEPVNYNLAQSSKSHRFSDKVSITSTITMAAVDNLSPEDKEFLDKCEEELKHRYTEKDEEFMKVFTAEVSTPPIIEPWWVPQNRRNDRRNDRRHHPYERYGNRDRNYQDRRDNHNRRGHNSYHRGNEDRGYYNQPRRYY